MDKNGSLDKALKILDLFIEHTQLSMTEVSKLLNYSTSATQRMLVSLVENRYLYRESDGLYRVAYKIMLLNNNVEIRRQLVVAASGRIDALSEQLGFVVNLSMLEHGDILVPIARSHNRSARYLIPNVGTPGNPENSASGKAMLAVCPDRERIMAHLEFRPYTPYSLTSPAQLRQEFLDIEQTGFAYDREELIEGLYCVSKRIPLSSDSVLCAVSVSGYKMAMLERIDTVRQALSEAVEDIRLQLETHIQE